MMGWVQGGQRSEPDEEYFLCINPLPHLRCQFSHLTVTSLHLHQAFVLIYKVNQCDKDTLLQTVRTWNVQSAVIAKNPLRGGVRQGLAVSLHLKTNS